MAVVDINDGDVCDEATALLIKREVSDGVIAPGYTPEAIEVLKEKRKGYHCIKVFCGKSTSISCRSCRFVARNSNASE